MGRVEVAAGDVESPAKGVAVASYPQNHQPMQMQPQFVGRPWTTGLFDCHLDQTNAVMTAFLPCVTFGQTAEVLDAGEMSCPLGSFVYMLMMPAVCSQWIMGSKYRTKLRNRYGLVEAPYSDVVSHLLCSCCALCQEFRELKARGLDPALGWNGIVAEQQYGTQPPPVQAMSK
ncbi:protein PLANT CADMIUM RESISTANCE 8-like [Salvia miltiorrhiza]|uniref:protein PLANT CADMIUM RESISTANCE 8-like n=1 Tax=Salvia miltiorrhiza TaxID=226208 RepID=UPI0025AC9944|nr:protein PLANT CADMIUM RESISTANCE 8-like [Salvia miltiorrhiza]